MAVTEMHSTAGLILLTAIFAGEWIISILDFRASRFILLDLIHCSSQTYIWIFGDDFEALVDGSLN